MLFHNQLVGVEGASDATIGVGIHDAGICAGLAVKQNHDSATQGRNGDVVAQVDVLADESRVHLVEHPVEGDGGILVHLADVLVLEKLVEIHRGVDGNDEMSLLQPQLQRGPAAQAAVRASVVLTFQPGMKPRVQILQAGQ